MGKILINYTTEVDTSKTISEIESTLAKFGALNISKKYDNGQPVAMAFQYPVNGEPLSFKIPMEKDKIMIVFNNAVKRGTIPKRYLNNTEQAIRVGWRIIKVWIESQIALLEINTVKVEEIFLPYLYNVETDETLFQKLEKRGFNLQIGYEREK